MSDWQPIETAPLCETNVIIAVPNEQHSSGYIIGEASYIGEGHDAGWWWAGTGPGDYHADRVWGATHWMPLPTPPVSTDTR